MLRTMLLRTAEFKGQVTAEIAAAATAAPYDRVSWYLREMTDTGLLCGAGSYSLTPAGRFALRLAIEVESNQSPTDQLLKIHERHTAFTTEFDTMIRDWRRAPWEAPAGLSDPAHQRAAVASVTAFHERFLSIVREAVECAGRLHPYPSRFSYAVNLFEGGDSRYLDDEALDSYLTVWREFRDELRDLLHLDRNADSHADRAA